MQLHERVEDDEIGAPALDGLAQRRFKRTDNTTTTAHLDQLEPFGAGEKQPSLELVSADSMMQACSQHAALEFFLIVLEADDEHTAAAEDILRRERPAGRQRHRLQQAQRSLAGRSR